MARQSNARAMVGASSGGRGKGLGFFREVYAELRRVTWPSPQEARRLTTLVITVAVIVGVVLTMVDTILSRFFNFILFP